MTPQQIKQNPKIVFMARRKSQLMDSDSKNKPIQAQSVGSNNLDSPKKRVPEVCRSHDPRSSGSQKSSRCLQIPHKNHQPSKVLDATSLILSVHPGLKPSAQQQNTTRIKKVSRFKTKYLKMLKINVLA